MKNSKRILVLFLIILLAKVFCSSQIISIGTQNDSIVCISTEQLKYANLIFAEHEKFYNENQLLKKELYLIQERNRASLSLKDLEIEDCKKINKNQKDEIKNLQKEIKDKDKSIKYLKIGSFTITLGIIVLFIIK